MGDGSWVMANLKCKNVSNIGARSGEILSLLCKLGWGNVQSAKGLVVRTKRKY